MRNVAVTNKGQLNNLINADDEFKKTNEKYYNETDEAKVTAYNNAIAEGKTKSSESTYFTSRNKCYSSKNQIMRKMH